MRKQNVLQNTRILSKLANSDCRENAWAFYTMIMRYTSAQCSTEFKIEMRGILNLFFSFFVRNNDHTSLNSKKLDLCILHDLGRFPQLTTGRPDYDRTSHFDNQMALVQNPSPSYILFKIWLIWLDSFDIIAMGMDWPVSSDKWKAPLNCFLNLME